jgi:hypothetical protein
MVPLPHQVGNRAAIDLYSPYASSNADILP